MTKLHITTEVNFGYKPKDTGLNITEENTEKYYEQWFCIQCHDEYNDDRVVEQYYLPGIVKAFTNYTGVLLANGKHITLHYGDVTTLPEGLFFEQPVLVKVIGKSTSKAGECLVVEVLVPNNNTITEQI